ncbi:MAG TPA: DUF4012 domain-containing protein [Egibacteraceae bacterium]
MLVGVWAGAVGAQVRPLRADVAAAQRALDAGVAALVAGDLGAARADLAAAERALADAAARLDGPALRLAGAVPLAGNSVDAVRGLVDAARGGAAAADDLTAALAALPDGIGSLAPRAGRLPLEPLQQLQPAVARAADRVRDARRTAAATPETWLLGAVAAAREAALERVTSLARTVEVADELADALPSLLGAGGPRRYLFGAQNPAELRGTGGFLGAFAVLEIDRGRLALSDFTPIHDLRNVPAEQLETTDLLAPRYERFGGAGFWPNLTMTPDFPSAARAAERLYQEVTGEEVDGTLLADPQMLAVLLRFTGPVQVPEIGVVDADSVVAVVANEAYDALPDPERRKHVLGMVAATALQRFLLGDGLADPLAAMTALGEAVADGHLLLHAADPAEQHALEVAGVAGALPRPSGGDDLAVFVNNAAANKVDFYTDRTVHYRVRLHGDGSAGATATVTLRNGAPTSGVTGYVIGPNVAGLAPGDNLSLVSAYCGDGCHLQGLTRSHGDEPAVVESELGHAVFTTPLRVPAGETAEVRFAWRVEQAWDTVEGRGRYRLAFADQVTLRPTRLVVEIELPDGTVVAAADPDLQHDGRVLRWDGQAPRSRTFEVRFQPAPAATWSERLAELVGRRVVVLEAP